MDVEHLTLKPLTASNCNSLRPCWRLRAAPLMWQKRQQGHIEDPQGEGLEKAWKDEALNWCRSDDMMTFGQVLHNRRETFPETVHQLPRFYNRNSTYGNRNIWRQLFFKNGSSACFPFFKRIVYYWPKHTNLEPKTTSAVKWLASGGQSKVIDSVDEVRKLRRDLGLFTGSDGRLLQDLFVGVLWVGCEAVIGATHLEPGFFPLEKMR